MDHFPITLKKSPLIMGLYFVIIFALLSFKLKFIWRKLGKQVISYGSFNRSTIIRCVYFFSDQCTGNCFTHDVHSVEVRKIVYGAEN